MRLGPPTTIRATQNGAWHKSNIWDEDRIPIDGDSVEIPAGISVSFRREESARIRYLHVEGELSLHPRRTTRLLVETLFVATGGTLEIGREDEPVAVGRSAEVIFISDGNPIDLVEDPGEMGRGLVSLGRIRVFGRPKTHRANMTQGARRGRTFFDLKFDAPVDWDEGDAIVLAGTHFLRQTSSQEEELEITHIAGRRVSFEPPLLHEHLPVHNDMEIHVAHLTRNVVFRSESQQISLRGHVMFMGSDVRMHHAAFIDLGRSDKTIPLDELQIDRLTGTPSPNPNIRNRRGRYSVHFHKNGIHPEQENPPSEVHGCVVLGVPGWGFVNHGSHVDFRNNVCFDFVGSAFVTEDGTELGNFIDNIALRGTGTGRYFPVRMVFANRQRAQPLADYGFGGDGFWFQGPAIRARNNVASGCQGAGMIWFTTGGLDISTNRYVGFSPEALGRVYADHPEISNLRPRHWADPNAPDAPSDVVISDLPILECDGFEAYGNLVGFRLRFNNFDNNSFYGEAPYHYDTAIVPIAPTEDRQQADRIRQKVRRLKLWNNELGLRVRYNEKTDWEDVQIVNKLRYRLRRPLMGAEIVHQMRSNTFQSLSIRGYPVAALTHLEINGVFTDNRGEITFVDDPSFGAFAARTTWFQSTPCTQLADLEVGQVTSNRVQLSWSPHPEKVRVLIRYRELESADGRWTVVVHGKNAGTSRNLNGLRPDTVYVYQVLAGCAESVSLWTPERTFRTVS